MQSTHAVPVLDHIFFSKMSFVTVNAAASCLQSLLMLIGHIFLQSLLMLIGHILLQLACKTPKQQSASSEFSSPNRLPSFWTFW